MKIQILLVGLLFLIGASIAIGHLTDEKLQNFQYNAELVMVAPIVDGYLDDPVWEEAIPVKLNQEIVSESQWYESDDFTGSFKAVWRGGFLYVAIKIQDDHFSKYHSKSFREDQLVLRIDEYHFQRKADVKSYAIPVGADVGPWKDPLTSIAWGRDGQSCEISFRLGDIAEKDNAIGFSITYHDVDNGHLQNKIAWGPAGYIEQEEMLPDIVFSANVNPNEQQKLIRWGQIKRLYK